MLDDMDSLSRLGTTAAAALLLLAGCGGGGEADHSDHAAATSSATPSASPSATDDHAHKHGQAAQPAADLRKGERFLDVAMPAAYRPSAPYGEGTDDYRCFLLDPRLAQDSFLTGIDIRPGNADVVHHVILFQVPPEHVRAAEAADARDEGQGWTCFGGSGLRTADARLDRAPWIGAWAPGGGEQVHEKGVGVPMEGGSRVIMQVHYNLLAGDEPDTTSARLRLADGDTDLDALDTVLLPAPVELPCRPGKDGELCGRIDAMRDVKARFGDEAGQLGDLLHYLCGTQKPGPVQSCTIPVQDEMTVRAAAGHMHLLGRAISIDVNDRRVLDIPVWDFDDQGSKPVAPVKLEPGDEMKVTCRHDQSLRDRLPAFEGQDERYVVWGEGTTDEMCLGILLVTRP